MIFEGFDRHDESPWATAALIGPCWVVPPSRARRLAASPYGSGWEWHDDVGHWCLLTNVVSGAPRETEAEQTRLVLERMNALLGGLGLNFRHVVRTWFFLDDILRWYDTFNRARTEFFQRQELLGSMPASTAVGPRLEGEPLILSGLLALEPRSTLTTVQSVPSPAQGNAFDYGSAFSRAVEVTWPRGKQLYVSGTASINGAGRTLHAGHLSAQMAETLRIISQLLDSRGMSFDDVTQAVCYVARGRDANSARLLAAEHFPRRISTLTATICRPDLDVEIELVASRECEAENATDEP